MNPAHRPWTTDDDTTLRRAWGEMLHDDIGQCCRAIAAILSRSSGAIRARLQRLGLHEDTSVRYGREERERRARNA